MDFFAFSSNYKYYNKEQYFLLYIPCDCQLYLFHNNCHDTLYLKNILRNKNIFVLIEVHILSHFIRRYHMYVFGMIGDIRNGRQLLQAHPFIRSDRSRLARNTTDGEE